jgi:GH24 family phage-related lysozyme (muramidase)
VPGRPKPLKGAAARVDPTEDFLAAADWGPRNYKLGPLIDGLQEREGLGFVAYGDTAGKPTIGWGHNLANRPLSAQSIDLRQRTEAGPRKSIEGFLASTLGYQPTTLPGPRTSKVDGSEFRNAIDKPLAFDLLKRDILAAEESLTRSLSAWKGLPDHQQRALVEMMFVLGQPTFDKFTDFKAAINAGGDAREDAARLIGLAKDQKSPSVWMTQAPERVKAIQSIFAGPESPRQ